jgi:hypothetical protein
MASTTGLRRWRILFAFVPVAAFADPAMLPTPLAKVGSCPSGYSTSGRHCMPGKKARYANEKRGSCPSGHATSGTDCLAGPRARPAIPKAGSCPSGWSTNGNYCLRH